MGSQPTTPKLFSGKLFCADCKGPLHADTETQRRKDGTSRRYVSYFCSTYGRSGRCVCSWHRIYEQTLTQIVLTEIQAQSQEVTLDKDAVVERLKQRIDGYNADRLSSDRQEITKLQCRVAELDALTAKLYEDKYGSAISEDTFILLMQKNEQERTAKAERLNVLLSKVDKAEKETAAIHSRAEIIRKYLNLQELDRAVVDELIDHIEIGERTVIDGQRHQDIKIFYRFVGLVK